MYLKALEIAGFKSFADKVRLDFKPGITSVIGPNGCGKSNVVDSIRWCIGEMSWKSLRSSSMVDIIFNGTAKRAPVGIAEVNMIFDNESRRLRLDFPEVTVTRRIFRSGESEYFLNKVQCRLRDIRDLFLDTGIGGEGYAIIDQGGVEFALSATPEMRRELFEEAAGVSKYKSKRDEAQRKLEKVDQDLARLMDSVVLIEEQIKKLDSEARKARLYQKNREELRESEIALSLFEIQASEAAANAAAAELSPLNEQLAGKNSRNSVLEGELAALNLNLTHKQNEAAGFSEKIASIRYEIGRLEGGLNNCDSMTELLTRQTGEFDHEDSVANVRKAEMEPALEKIKSQIAVVTDIAAPLQAEYDRLNAQLSAIDADINSAMTALDRGNSDLMRASQSQMECSTKISLAQSAISHDTEDLVNLEKDFQKSSEQANGGGFELEKLRAEFEAQKVLVAQSRSAIEELENGRAALFSRQNETAEQLSVARSSKAALNATLEMLTVQAGKDPYWIGAQAAVGLEGAKGTLRQQLQIAPADRLLVEEAMGEFLDAVLCADFDSARRAIAHVKTQPNARVRFIVLSAVPAAEPAAADSLRSRIQCAPELENLVSYLLNRCRAEGSSVEGQFWIVGGADSVQSPQEYKGRQEEVRLGLDAAQARETELSVETARLAGEIKDMEGQLASARAGLGGEISKESGLAAAVSSKEADIKNLREELSLIEQDKARFMANREGRQTELVRLAAEMDNFKSAQDKLRSEIEALKTRRQGLQEESAVLKSRRDETGRSLNDLRGQRNALEADMRGVSTALGEILQGFERRAGQRAQALEKIAVCAQDKLSFQAKLSTQRGELAELEKGESALREELTAMRAEFDAKNKDADALKKEISALQLAAHDLDAKINSHTARREAVIKDLQENWQTTVEEARMKYSGMEVDAERVKMLRRRLDNMGPVNMTAPEEYDALSARDQFLRAQINDLEQAKNDLKAAISRINATTRENFRHTYDQVRDHFRRIYQTLFTGGEADLLLTQPENLLETGVEIMAQPPGKKLQSISALSGGEKALTALALLFSFFCVNPSPFCIMDEADAPLDEANVERFVGLIREFAQKTQFIIITHNKRTMEAAGVLYGVTMEQHGVSKVMSVSLQRTAAAPHHAEAAAAV